MQGSRGRRGESAAHDIILPGGGPRDGQSCRTNTSRRGARRPITTAAHYAKKAKEIAVAEAESPTRDEQQACLRERALVSVAANTAISLAFFA